MSALRRTLYLHIGIPKTASTWLQKQVFPHLQHVRLVSRPRTELFAAPANEPMMETIFRQSSRIWSGFGDAIFECLLGDRKTWASGDEDLLLSDEAIGRSASRPELLAAHLSLLRQKASEWGFHHVKVLCIIRRQDHWLASHYAQVSHQNRRAGQADFEEFLLGVTSPNIARYRLGMLLDFNVLYDELIDVLGPAGLVMVPYEALKEAPIAFLQMVLGSVGTPAAAIGAIAEMVSGSTENVRGEEGSWRLRPRNASVFGVSVPGRMMLRRRIESIHLRGDLSRSILETYADGNQQLARKTEMLLAQHGYF